MLLGDTDAQRAVAVAATLAAAFAEPFSLQGIAVRCTVSIGVSLAPQHGTDLSSLLHRADTAMYQAKNAHTGHHLYDAAQDDRGHERLRTALTQGQLTLLYNLSSTWRPARSAASRPSCAGTIPPVGCSVPTLSSAWSRTTA